MTHTNPKTVYMLDLAQSWTGFFAPDYKNGVELFLWRLRIVQLDIWYKKKPGCFPHVLFLHIICKILGRGFGFLSLPKPLDYILE